MCCIAPEIRCARFGARARKPGPCRVCTRHFAFGETGQAGHTRCVCCIAPEIRCARFGAYPAAGKPACPAPLSFPAAQKADAAGRIAAAEQVMSAQFNTLNEAQAAFQKLYSSAQDGNYNGTKDDGDLNTYTKGEAS